MANEINLIGLGMPPALAREVALQIDGAVPTPASNIVVDGFTTAGGTTIAAGNLQTVLEAIADLADPDEG